MCGCGCGGFSLEDGYTLGGKCVYGGEDSRLLLLASATFSLHQRWALVEVAHGLYLGGFYRRIYDFRSKGELHANPYTLYPRLLS